MSGKLRNLDLSRNRIPALPANLGSDFRLLRTLRLSDNRLTALPESVGDLAKLETLLVAGNLLHSLPASMARYD